MFHTNESQEVTFLASSLRMAERAGNLSEAYGLFRGMRAPMAQAVALQAGHSVVSTTCRHFWPHLQGQIAEACRNKADGYAMRDREAHSLRRQGVQ